MPFEFIQIPANAQGAAKEALNAPLLGGCIASVPKEFVANAEDSFWSFFERQQRFPVCPQLRPQAPEGTRMSPMGLNRSSSHSQPPAGWDKITMRPPCAGSPADAGSNAPGGHLFQAHPETKLLFTHE
jgi:hypothetical protein